MPKYWKSVFHKISSKTPDYNLDPPDYDEDLEERLQIEEEERLAAELEEEVVN